MRMLASGKLSPCHISLGIQLFFAFSQMNCRVGKFKLFWLWPKYELPRYEFNPFLALAQI
jgi:hypothetical protein